MFRGIVWLGSTNNKEKAHDIGNYAKEKFLDVNTYEKIAGQLILAKGIGLVGENPLNLGVESIAARRAELFSELNKLGVKYSPNDVLNIGRNMEGKVIFLEKGMQKPG